jgi:hypothetical protein
MRFEKTRFFSVSFSFLQALSLQQSVVAVAGMEWESAKFAGVRSKDWNVLLVDFLQALSQQQSVVMVACFDGEVEKSFWVRALFFRSFHFLNLFSA